ncbi:MAG: class I SAM-dependent RNA methyltransferase, partial [bacterium]|nr:class I SAM-dependent RNA methyltransferase [bacterium]
MTTDRVCPHFGDCGGCAAQDVAYADQLVSKEAVLRELLAEYWDQPIPITPSPDLWHYRNKVDPSFARKQYPEPPPKGFQRETVLGFKRKGKWFWTLDIEDCLIAPEGTGALMNSVRQWARANSLTAFSSKSKDGFLRILLVRAGRRTGQRMVVLVTNDGDLDRDGFVAAVQDVFPCESIHWAVFRGMAEIAAADEMTLLHGAETIDEVLEVPGREEMDPLRFRISPFSFFQTNALGAERLYGHIREWVAETGANTLYDLYGGAGCIAFTCADLVSQVV